jgi:hypothetical protein
VVSCSFSLSLSLSLFCSFDKSIAGIVKTQRVVESEGISALLPLWLRPIVEAVLSTCFLKGLKKTDRRERRDRDRQRQTERERERA